MPNDNFNPLNENDCACIDQLLKGAPLTREFLEKCKRCGLDVDDMIAENERHVDFASRIKREFYPERV